MKKILLIILVIVSLLGLFLLEWYYGDFFSQGKGIENQNSQTSPLRERSNSSQNSDPSSFEKPAIYVYDQLNRTQSVSINFHTDGIFTHIEPNFTIHNGWVFSTNNGKIVVDEQSFDYLYYAADVSDYLFKNDGRHVQGKDINNFFNDKLPKMGFNTKEQADFIEYRKEKFTTEKNYFISFRFNEEIDKYISLNFSIQPTQINRVLLEAREIASIDVRYDYQNVKNDFDNKLLRKAKRGGELDIFERGGTYMNIKN